MASATASSWILCECLKLFVLTQRPLLLQEYKDKVPQAVIDAINTEVANVRGVMESGNPEEIRAKVSALQQALMKIGESLSKGSAGDQGSSQAGSSPGGDDQEEKKEQKGP